MSAQQDLVRRTAWDFVLKSRYGLPQAAPGSTVGVGRPFIPCGNSSGDAVYLQSVPHVGKGPGGEHLADQELCDHQVESPGENHHGVSEGT